jgi:hypothetical protein
MSRIKIIKKNSQNINKELKIGFWDNYLGERGTTVALFDYAYYNQKLLNNKSIIFNNIAKNSSVPRVVEKFKKEFPVFDVNEFSGAEEIIKKEAIDVLYVIKSGEKDNRISKHCKTVIHCVFSCFQPHGNIYSSIAPWVKGNGGKYPFVPHMINLPKHDKDMRKELSIPEEAVVFGRHGGYNQFDINFVKKIIIRNFANNMKYYFVFVNTKPFHHAKNIIYLDKIIDLEEKVRFINTCDAMLWARSDGETFGLSIGEFSTLNKPVIATKNVKDNCHVRLLNDKGIWYNSPQDLIQIIKNFDKEEVKKKDWNSYKEYTPEKVMDIFNKVFLTN